MYHIVRKPKNEEDSNHESSPSYFLELRVKSREEVKDEIKRYLKDRFPYLKKDDIKTFRRFIVSVMDDYDMMEDHAPESIGEIVDIMLYDPLAMQDVYCYEDHIEWMDILSRIKLEQ